MDKFLLTLPDFCERHSISRTAVYREVSAGRLKLTKRGSRSLIAADDAEAWRKALPTIKREAAE